MINDNRIVFWLVILIFLTVFFTVTGTPFVQAFYFISFLFPVVIGTSYFFNNILIPKYLIKEKYFEFFLYSIYLIIISLYLEFVIIFLSLILFSYFQLEGRNILVIDLLSLSLAMYLIVLINGFIQVFKSLKEKEKLIITFEEREEINKIESINVKSNRQIYNIQLATILYVESLNDYVKIVTDKEEIITKEKISHLQLKLPEKFIRIHRSFIINRNRITSFNTQNVEINNESLPISRTYRKSVISILQV